MSEYREILTKAVVGKGRKYGKTTHTVTPKNPPTSILGCWIINHEYKARRIGKYVEVAGTYDINLWYSYDNNTKTEVKMEKANYHDKVKVRVRDDVGIDEKELEIVTKFALHPNCSEAVLSPHGSKGLVTVEREIVVELVGETMLCILVSDGGFVEEWTEEIDDEELADLHPDDIE